MVLETPDWRLEMTSNHRMKMNCKVVLREGLWRFLISAVIVFLVFGAAMPVLAESDQEIPSLPDDPETETTQPVPPLSPERAALLAQFQEPQLTPQQTAAILAGYTSIDPNHVIPKHLLQRTLVYYDVNKRLIPNPNRLSVVDFSQESRNVRWHIINMATGEVVSIRVAHGKGSDPDNIGRAVKFSNVPQSQMSSLGFYLTAEEYAGEEGDCRCRLDGLSPTNSNVRPRAIVIHQADYVVDENVKIGRSWGCLAVSIENHTRVVKELKEGSLIFVGTN